MTLKLNFAHVCDAAFLSQDNKLNIIGIFERLFANRFPFQYPRVTVVCNVTIGIGKFPFKILILKKGQEKPAWQLVGEITSDAEKDFNLIADFQNITFEDQREYTVEIWFDEKLLGERRFEVGLLVKK